MAAFGGKALYLGSIKEGVELTFDPKTDTISSTERIQRAIPSQELFSELLAKLPPREEQSGAPEENKITRLIRDISEQQATEDEFCNQPFPLSFIPGSTFKEKKGC